MLLAVLLLVLLVVLLVEQQVALQVGQRVALLAAVDTAATGAVRSAGAVRATWWRERRASSICLDTADGGAAGAERARESGTGARPAARRASWRARARTSSGGDAGSEGDSAHDIGRVVCVLLLALAAPPSRSAHLVSISRSRAGPSQKRHRTRRLQRHEHINF